MSVCHTTPATPLTRMARLCIASHTLLLTHTHTHSSYVTHTGYYHKQQIHATIQDRGIFGWGAPQTHNIALLKSMCGWDGVHVIVVLGVYMYVYMCMYICVHTVVSMCTYSCVNVYIQLCIYTQLMCLMSWYVCIMCIPPCTPTPTPHTPAPTPHTHPTHPAHPHPQEEPLSMSWESIPIQRHLFLALANPIHRLTVLEFPVYVPSAAEKADPKLFAANVRALMVSLGWGWGGGRGECVGGEWCVCVLVWGCFAQY